jgi:signal transduction histidine kinase
MLHNIDINQMNALMEVNPVAKDIISKLLANHHEVLSTISHEIRNPLTLISSSMQVMEVQHPEVKEFAHWTQTTQDVEFVCQLLNELSTFNNSSTLHYSVFSMERLMKNIAISFAISLDNTDSEIEFSSEIPSDLGEFKGDRIKMEEVLLNLLKNAKESIQGDGEIQLRAHRDDHTLTIQCQDTGCGIADDIKGSIFEPFKTYKRGGTGLGLSLSKRIVNAHGGSISVRSKVNEGSTFIVQLPI